MKPLFATLFILVTLSFAVQKTLAQNHPNNVEFDSIRITTKGHKVYLPLHTKQQGLIKAFGKPLRIEKWHNEEDNKDGVKVVYPGANFYFIDDSLDGFDFAGLGEFEAGLTDQNVYTGVGGNVLKFKKMKMIADRGGFFNVQHHGIDADELLSFENYKGTGLIQRIIYTSYNANQDNSLKLEDLNLPEPPDGKP